MGLLAKIFEIFCCSLFCVNGNSISNGKEIINFNSTNTSSNIIKSSNDISTSIDETDVTTISLNSSISGSLSYNDKIDYFRYTAQQTVMVKLKMNYNVVYNKHINVDVYCKLNTSVNYYKYLYSYDSSLIDDSIPHVFIQESETYLFRISEKSSSIGVEFTYSGQLLEIQNYDYYSIDYDTGYTKSFEFQSSEPNINLNKEQVNTFNTSINSYHVNDTTIYPYSAVGGIECDTWVWSNNSLTSGGSSGSGVSISDDLVYSAAHVFINDISFNGITHKFFVENPRISPGRDGAIKPYGTNYFRKVIIPKEYFVYSANGPVYEERSNNFDWAIGVLRANVNDTINFPRLRFDNNFDLNGLYNLTVFGCPGGTEYNNEQWHAR